MYPPVYEESDLAEVYFLYWGNFMLHHSVTTMVRATASLPYWGFLLAGERMERERTVREVESLGLNMVSYPRFLLERKPMEYIESASVVPGPIVDTQTSMNIGSKVAEAFFKRKAIDLADHPASIEVLNHGESVIFVELQGDDALVEPLQSVLTNDSLQR